LASALHQKSDVSRLEIRHRASHHAGGLMDGPVVVREKWVFELRRAQYAIRLR
jgi:hypothetical protein